MLKGQGFFRIRFIRASLQSALLATASWAILSRVCSDPTFFLGWEMLADSYCSLRLTAQVLEASFAGPFNVTISFHVHEPLGH